MKYYTNQNLPPRIDTPTGSKKEAVYELKVDNKGIERLEKTNQFTNVYERTQACLEETKIENIIRRHMQGDETALNLNSLKEKAKVYDLTNYPKTLMEMQNILIEAEQTFDKLPIEVKKEFNQNYREYIVAMSDGTFEDKYKKAMKSKGNKGQRVENINSVTQQTVTQQTVTQPITTQPTITQPTITQPVQQVGGIVE